MKKISILSLKNPPKKIFHYGFEYLAIGFLFIRSSSFGMCPKSVLQKKKFTLQKVIPRRLVEVDIVKYWGWGPNLSDLNILIEDRAKVWNLKDLQAETQSVGVWGGDGDNNILQMIIFYFDKYLKFKVSKM